MRTELHKEMQFKRSVNIITNCVWVKFIDWFALQLKELLRLNQCGCGTLAAHLPDRSSGDV